MRRKRREFVAALAGTATGAVVAWPSLKSKYQVSYLKPQSRVAVLEATAYSAKLEQILMEGLRLFNMDLRGRSILLKPNLVEHLPNRPINTHPLLVGAAASCFLRLGAKRVVVGEGPGHERDTEMVVSETGFERELRDRGVEFIDLNRDQPIEVKLKANYSGLHHLWLPGCELDVQHRCEFHRHDNGRWRRCIREVDERHRRVLAEQRDFVAVGSDNRGSRQLAGVHPAVGRIKVVPYWNTNDAEGQVCVGSMRTPDCDGVGGIEAWERGFFQSEFTHPYGAARLTSFPGGFLSLWRHLAGSTKPFPVNYLADARQTLREFVEQR